MYERFTDRARRALRRAQQEALSRGHSYLGTEHILLGLLTYSPGMCKKVLQAHGVFLDDARAEVRRIVQSAPASESEPEDFPPTPRAQGVIEYAVEEAQKASAKVSSDHLLLGILEQRESVSAQVLMNLGLKLEDVRKHFSQRKRNRSLQSPTARRPLRRER